MNSLRLAAVFAIVCSILPAAGKIEGSDYVGSATCRSCHPARIEAESAGTKPIQNPKRLTAVQISTLCGACHRQASDLDDDADWTNAWNVRHQPRYLHRAACFRNSNGALSCLTCHDPHQPLKRVSSSFDARCVSCHPKVTHTSPVASRACADCHMPQLVTSANLKFTNHWIGIYDPSGPKLVPSKRAVKDLRPVPGKAETAGGFIVPADVSTLIPVYAQALVERERQSGPDSGKVARAASNLGLFLLGIEKSADAEAPLRRALSIDEHNTGPTVDADRENLALALEAQGKITDARSLFQLAAEGHTPGVAARSFAKLAEKDPEHAEAYFLNAVAAEEKASGADSPRVAILLHQYALALRGRNRDGDAEPVLRRALAIQQAAAKPNAQVTVGILNTLGNLLEG